MKSFLCLAALFGPSAVATAVDFVSATVDAVPRANAAQLMMNRHVNSTDPTKNLKRGPSLEELEQQREERIERTRERRELARQKIANLQPDLSQLEFVTKEELDSLDADEHPWIRRAGWRNDWNSAYVLNVADPSLSYDRWAQAYRMLGGFIDCDHQKSQRGGGKNDNKNNNNNQEQGSGCSRWMMWAAYVDPNYQGNGYNEYYGDNPKGVLDCHSPDTHWELLGVYRQEFYQFIEQISKHLWAYDEYEYIVALAGLSYMTNYECFAVGADNSGNTIYASVAPKSEGRFEMALYTDDYCLQPNNNLGKTYDSFGLTTSMNNNDKNDKNGNNNNNNNNNYDNSGYYDWWTAAQEYTFTNLNDVYESFRYCTSCMDYPTYQDGYFIGDDGTDDGDLINQCWKFYSHNSYTCESDCIAMGHAQGTILSVTIDGTTFGQTISNFYTVSSFQDRTGSVSESRWSRMLANSFVTLCFIVFVATFLAFAVARRSRHRERASGRSRRLLDESSRRSSRSKSAARSGGMSASGKSSSRSKSRSKSTSGRSRKAEYEPPSSKSGRSSSRKSRRHYDDF